MYKSIKHPIGLFVHRVGEKKEGILPFEMKTVLVTGMFPLIYLFLLRDLNTHF